MAGRGLKLRVDLSAIVQNYRHLCKVAGKSTTSAVVKADSYGLGADKICPLLYSEDCREFFVARIGEAIALKDYIPSTDTTIYVMDGITNENDLKICHTYGFIPVLNSLNQIRIYKAHPCPAALHIDTGMNRLGIRTQDINKIDLPKDNIVMVMSHAACADDEDDTMTEGQFKAFKQACEAYPKAKKSFCNSAATLKYPYMHCDLVRPGIAIYGGFPGMKPVVSLSAPILQIRNIPKGETIGYGATYTAETDLKTATLGIGYADGLSRILTNRGRVFIGGHACSILGRVSMDLTSINISDLTGEAKSEDEVEILGPHQTIMDLAKDAQTISYEVITTLGKTIEKCYLNNKSI